MLPTKHHLASHEGINGYATYQGMYEHNLYSLRYVCTFSYSKNNSKFPGSLLKIYVCDVNKTLLSMKVEYAYVIQNQKYTGVTVQGQKNWNTVRVISYQFYLYINVISVLCNLNGTLFQTCLILHVWLKSIILVFANILNTFFSFLPLVFISKHAIHNWFYTLIENWCRNTQSVRNKVIHKNYVFSVASRTRTFRLGRNKELVLTNKQKQFCKHLLFLRDTRSRDASDAGEFHLKTKSRDFRVIFDEKWRSTLRLKYVGLQ
jgi:hypothetical protein